MKRFLFLVLLLGIAFATTNTTTTSGTWTSGTWRESTDTPPTPIDIELSTKIQSTLNVVPDNTSYNPGSTVVLTITKSAVWAYNGTFSASSSAPAGAGSSSSPNDKNVALNFNSGVFNAIYDRFSSGCAYWVNSSVKFACLNKDSDGSCTPSPTNPNIGSCLYNPFSAGGTTGQRAITYYNKTSSFFSGNGKVIGICNGTISVNGVVAGNIENVNTYSITIPSNASGTYPVKVAMSYKCFFALDRLFSGSPSHLDPLYYRISNISVYNTINLTVLPPTCTDKASISLSSPPINLDCTTNSTSITLTVTNKGNVTVTVNSITASVGTLNIYPGQLPISLAPGQSYLVNGTFSYNGATSSVRFTASGNATVCGAPVTVTATWNTSVNRSCACSPPSFKVTATPASLIVNDSTRTQNVNLSVTNTGSTPFNITAITVSGLHTYTFSPRVPILVNAGQTVNIIGNFTWNGQLPTGTTIVTFTVIATNPCGSATNTTTITVHPPPCAENASMSMTGPGPINLNASNQSTITITLTNTGNSPITVNAITASSGTFTPNAGQLPRLLPVGGSITVTGVYTYNGPVPVFITFTASGNATLCGTPTTVTAKWIVRVNGSACPDIYSFTVSAAPNPATLNTSNQARINITITNTGNISLNVTGITTASSNTSFTNLNTTLPLLIPAGQSRTIEGTLTTPANFTGTVTFLISASAYPCGVLMTLTNTTTITINPCNQSASITITGPAAATLNGSNQTTMTFNITNTGNVNVTITDILPSVGSFAPTGLPAVITPGNSILVSGVYTYNGATPVSVFFTAVGNATECGVPRTVSATMAVPVVITSCLSAGIMIVGHSPEPVTLVNNRANLTLTITNNGSVPINVTGFATSPGFAFTPTDALPFQLTVGEARNFQGEIRYTGAGAPPGNFTITVFANTSATDICGLASVNDTASVGVVTEYLPNLVPEFNGSFSRIGPQEERQINVSIRNKGPGDATSFDSNITVQRCNSATDCEKPMLYNYVFGSSGLNAGEATPPEELSLTCEGWDHINIDVRADVADEVQETSETDNNDTRTISCAKESCSISGPDKIEQPGEYVYTASCFDANRAPVMCSEILSENFRWSFRPPPLTGYPSSFIYYEAAYSGDMLNTSILRVQQIFTNGTLLMWANGTLKDYQNSYIVCDYRVAVNANICIQHI